MMKLRRGVNMKDNETRMHKSGKREQCGKDSDTLFLRNGKPKGSL